MLSLVACQKSDPPPIQINEKHEVSAVIDLTEMCKNLGQSMQNIDNTRTIFALEQINQNLKICIPLSDFKQQMNLLHLSTQMYNKFLTVQRNAQEQKAFELYALDLAQHPTIQNNHQQGFSLRDQYLLKHKGQAYVELHEVDHHFVYRRSPQYLARIFAPYLPKAERVFIEHLAEQNMQNLFQNNRVSIDADEILIRALFWENYIEQYPKSHFIQEAKYLSQIYSQLLFKGTQEDPVSESYSNEYDIKSDHLFAIKKLATSNQSQLSDQARRFLALIHLNQTNSDQDSAVTELNQQLNLKFAKPNPKLDCFSDAICHIRAT